MHILFLTDNFPPEVNAPASRTFEHCREWVKAGCEVTVITCAPNFPHGKVYSGYRNRLWQTESMDGIRVIRVWTYMAANEGFVRRVMDYVSFMLAATLAVPFVPRPSLIVGTSPQFFTACAAYLASRLRGVPFVFELRDLWPESIKAVGAMKDSAILRFFERLELFLYRRAEHIVSVTESFRDVLARRGVDAGKISVVTNGVDGTRFRPMPKDPELLERLGLEGKFVAGYIGTHGLAHHLETVLDAAKMLHGDRDGGDFRFLFLGDGASKPLLQSKAREMGLDNVLFVDSVPKAEVPRYWSLLDASIIHLKKTPLFETVIPSKLFECMGMGIPVVHGVAGESAEIVRRHDAGLVFEPENSSELVCHLQTLRNDPGLYARLQTNGLVAVRDFDRSTLAVKMLRILEQLVPERISNR